jgi:phage shock protein C
MRPNAGHRSGSAFRRTIVDFRCGGANLRSTDHQPIEDDMAESDELERLGELHRRGILTDEEFSRAKSRVLNAAAAPGQAPIVNAINGLQRHRDDRWLAGICGGIGRVTGVASWVWRLLFSALVLCAGTGIVLYLLMWIFVPMDPVRAGAGQATA